MSPEIMRRALELAERGRGFVHPNPLVGAVLVRDGKIIGEGWHTAFGKPHAEIEALADALKRGESVRGATIYVSLEPCCHHGKTPPCTDAIIASGIEAVVFASGDPNPEVSGRGRARLEAAGVAVKFGVEEAAARELNRAYYRFRETGLPFITWKIAQTPEGKLTREPGKRTRITGPEADRYVDRLRATVDAVLIGAETALVDDPGLRVRDKSGRDPWRIVFDSGLRITPALRLIKENSDRRTIIVTTVEDVARHRTYTDAGVEILVAPAGADGRVTVRAALEQIARRGLIDILCESGRTLGDALTAAGLVQRLLIIQPGMAATRRGRLVRTETLGGDVLIECEL